MDDDTADLTLADPTSHASTVRSGPPRLDPGQRFRGLLVHSLLGRGAMGEAYLASHSILKTPLVIKTFSGSQADFFGEAHLAARVTSPFIVGVVDAGVEEGVPYIVQQYVDGIDFGELTRRLSAMQRTIPSSLVAHFLGQIARGLHEVHQAGVVHRDIKPQNLFLNGEGETLAGDFGVALDPHSYEGQPLAGTPGFIAPELWRHEPPDARADIYALGATAHLLLTGERAFAGSVPTIARAHLHRTYEPPRVSDPDDAYVFAVVTSMLSKSPDDRPGNMDEVARMLSRVASRGPEWILHGPHHAEIGDVTLRLERGDLAATRADVIVNAANWQMTMDLGVAKCLREAGGPELAHAALAHAPARMGDVSWTGGFGLPTSYVAHAVAALAGAICLQRCTIRVLLEAQSRGVKTIAMPAIGTGVGSVPQPLAAKLVLETIGTVARLGPSSIDELRIVLRDDDALGKWSYVLSGM